MGGGVSSAARRKFVGMLCKFSGTEMQCLRHSLSAKTTQSRVPLLQNGCFKCPNTSNTISARQRNPRETHVKNFPLRSSETDEVSSQHAMYIAGATFGYMTFTIITPALSATYNQTFGNQTAKKIESPHTCVNVVRSGLEWFTNDRQT